MHVWSKKLPLTVDQAEILGKVVASEEYTGVNIGCMACI